MGRTDNLQVIAAFTRRMQYTIAHHKELLIAINNKRNEAALASMLSEQFVMTSAILWEAFINDLVITYISMKPSQCKKSLEARVQSSLKSKFGMQVSRRCDITFPSKCDKVTVAAWVDPQGWNITPTSANAFASRLSELLVAEHARKFSFTAEDSQFLDLLTALRNFLGHRSKGARTILKQRIANLSGAANAPFSGQLRDVAVYLKYETGGECRAILAARRLLDIAALLG